MVPPQRAADPPSAEAVRAWLVERLAQALAVSAAEITIEGSLLDSGLDSLTAITLAADLEDWLGIELEPTLLWDHPTVADLTAYLQSSVHGGRE
jgi:acyl carrier protein